ncbi:uncharacterized protein LOC105694300 [Orussus abietinus]|uniref:uncharacterized protein LOC105694300 n=1 Tax=Orussus abietinus TaxID=222816 RepID=UPI0006265916|nr:uncharacterized protein LOC105694300 [Orussus abietinus]
MLGPASIPPMPGSAGYQMVHHSSRDKWALEKTTVLRRFPQPFRIFEFTTTSIRDKTSLFLERADQNRRKWSNTRRKVKIAASHLPLEAVLRFASSSLIESREGFPGSEFLGG